MKNISMSVQKNSLLLIVALLFFNGDAYNAFSNVRKDDEAQIKRLADNLKLDSSDTEACHNCNLLKEKNLVFIDLNRSRRKENDAKKNIDTLLKIFKSMDLDLYSDKVLFTYIDKNGESKKLTVREHNEHVLAEQVIPGVPAREGYRDILNKLIVQNKRGIVNGYNDETLQQLRKSHFILTALPLCGYSEYGPIGLGSEVYVTGLSLDDEKNISEKLNLNLLCKSAVCTYQLNDLSRKELDRLLHMLCKSNTVSSIYFDHSLSMINH